MKLILFAILFSSVTLLAAPSVGPLSPSPTSIPAGSSTSVTFSLPINGGTPLANSVNLVQVDSAGNVLGILGVMNDAGNGNFQLTLTLTPLQGATALYFEATAAFAGMLQRVKSAVLAVPVTSAPPTITISPTSLTFPPQPISTTSSVESFTITAGPQPVNIISVNTSGDFAISVNNCGAGLAANSACTVGVTFTPTVAGVRTSTVAIADNAAGSPQSVALSGSGQITGTPTITSVAPVSGPIGTVVTLALSNFTPAQGAVPQITLSSQSGGAISAPISSFSATNISFVIPAGAATGVINLTFGTQTAASGNPFTVTTSSNFTINIGPSSANLIQGQSVAYAVTLNSSNGFNGLAALAVTGLPSGIQSSFKPTSITAGQTAILTLTASATQANSTSILSVLASANIDGQTISQSANASLQVIPVTTTFLGRTVVDDAQETPIGGVTVKFLGVDAQGNATGCSGQTTSDASGSFSLTSLPTRCIGPQLISYNGATATAPAGKYAGVNLSYTLTANQVTTSPVLIHLPRIDNGETVEIQQNSPTNQVFTFQSIPGLFVTVYAGTTFTLDDGSQPNPFPLIAVEVPLDRLPEQMATNGMVTPFIVAFQPANAVASQPVAVNFPNPLGLAPGSPATLVTLDPTRGFMVPYGTGVVSGDGTQFIANPDPGHPGHNYGLVHFDWHGASQPSPGQNPCPECEPASPGGAYCAICPRSRAPIDFSSGLEVLTNTDVNIQSSRGSLQLVRTYRTLSSNPGPFGIGTGTNYSYELNTYSPQSALVINLMYPDGGSFPFSRTSASVGSLTNNSTPNLIGVSMIPNPDSTTDIRWKDGTIWHFVPIIQPANSGSFLSTMTDPNGNVTTVTWSSPPQAVVTQVTDPVGRSLKFTYDASQRILSVTDPIGRKVQYSYNSQGTLATVTDQAGGISSFTYDSQNRVISIVDQRGVTTVQNAYDGNGRVVQQTAADGGVSFFAYTLQNPAVPTSPVLQTAVIDPLGNETVYRFNAQGLLVSATDPAGQTKTFTRDPAHNNLVSGYTGPGVCAVCGDPTGGDVAITFDSAGNVITSTDSLGNTTSATYDASFNKPLDVTDPLHNVIRLTYDTKGNPLTLVDANGNATQFNYDALGNLTQVTDPLGSTTTATFDSLGNISAVTDALGNTSHFAYDAVSRLTRATTALEQSSAIAYDSLDRPTSLTDPKGETTSFSYDPTGNILSFKDARGGATQYSYDPAGRLTTRTSPLGNIERYIYDADSNLVQHSDRRGQVSTFSYDAVNRLVQETYVDAIVSRTYDTYSRLLAVIDSMSGNFEFVYDTAGHLLSQAGPTGGIGYLRDGLGRVITRQVAGQATLGYTYDPAGNLTATSMPLMIASINYTPTNHPSTITRGTGIASTYRYDADGRPISIVHASGTGILAAENYSYDAVGNRVNQATNIAQPLVTPPTANRFNVENELTEFGTTVNSYDANGNISQAGNGTKYLWDGRNRLKSIATNGQTTAFTYDFSGNLISQADKGSEFNLARSYVLDDLTNIVYETASDGTSYSVLTGRNVDSHLALSQSNGLILFGMGDALNSTVATVDQTGTMQGQFLYEPFGQTTASASYPFQYTGRTPAAAGLYYYRRRFYNPTTGRFVSQDPLDIAGGDSNLYRYVSNDPITERDPTGLQSSLLCWAKCYLEGLIPELKDIPAQFVIEINKAFNHESKDTMEAIESAKEKADLINCIKECEDGLGCGGNGPNIVKAVVAGTVVVAVRNARVIVILVRFL